jgi:hypothetical protein
MGHSACQLQWGRAHQNLIGCLVQWGTAVELVWGMAVEVKVGWQIGGINLCENDGE